MMRCQIKWVVTGVLLIVLAATGSALAEQEKRWRDKAELSFVQTGGNTAVTTLAAKNDWHYQFSPSWQVSWTAGILYGETDGEKTAERYVTDLRLDYDYSESAYIYTLAGWLQDTFAGFDHRYYAGPGGGYHFSNGPRHFLTGELGINYAREMYINETESDFFEGRAFGRYAYSFNDKVSFSQQVEYLHNFRDTQKYKIIGVTALETKINDLFSVKAAYEVRYDHAPVPDTLDTTDTMLSVSLVANL